MRLLFSINPFSLISFYLNIQFNFASSDYLASPINIKIEDFFKNGKLSKVLTDSFCNNSENDDQSSTNVSFKAIYVTFDSCSANSVYKNVNEFKKVVYNTMLTVEKNSKLTQIKNPKKTEAVIEAIYNSAVHLNATHNQLLVFTALSLHNMYTFFKFTDCNKNENKNSIGKISRGLLQLTSIKYYYELMKISSSDYMNYPYLLNEFSNKSIYDEFQLFMLEFSSKNSCSNLPSQVYIKSLIQLNPQELELISASFIGESFNSLENIDSKDVKDYLQKLIRRYNIFQTLLIITDRLKKTSENVSSQFLNTNL